VIHPSADWLSKALDFPAFGIIPGTVDWQAPHETEDPITTEVDTLALLFALVRLVRPLLAVETGCGKGAGARAIGLALASLGTGKLVTCDINEAYCQKTTEICANLPMTIIRCEGKDLGPLPAADFVYIDSGLHSRGAEMALVKPGAITVIHDTNSDDIFTEVKQHFTKYVRLPGIHGPTIAWKEPK